VRLRGYGVYSMNIANPIQFINTVVGREGDTPQIKSRITCGIIVVARLNDYSRRESQDLLDLPRVYTEMAAEFKAVVTAEFDKLGLGLKDFYISAITPPDDVQKIIDQRSGMGVLDGNLDNFLKFEVAKAVGQSTEGQGPGDKWPQMGMGMLVPSMVAGQAAQGAQPGVTCPKCHFTGNPQVAKFLCVLRPSSDGKLSQVRPADTFRS